jgi:acetyl-CoA synthetase
MEQETAGRIVWEPDERMLTSSNVAKFMKKHNIPDVAYLRSKSVAEQEWFWSSLEKELGTHWFAPYGIVVDKSGGPEWAKWFVGGRMNISYQCLEANIEKGNGNSTAIIFQSEGGEISSWSYDRLNSEVSALAHLLKENGIGGGDRVGIYMPMLPQIVAALLSIMKIGAIAVPLFSGFGSSALAVRLDDTNARAVISADGTYRRGKKVDMLGTLLEATASMSFLKSIVVFKNISHVSASSDRQLLDWPSGGKTDSRTAETSAEDNALILYSSGTTGRPKGTVHTHIGAFLQTAKEVRFNVDIHAGERLLWVTDLGWMMGPWEVIGALSNGGTVCLMEGAIDYPSKTRLWKFIEEAKVNVLGISPTVIRALKGTDDDVRAFDFSSLRILASTGEPWDVENWMWYFDRIGRKKAPIINLSGGTEIIGCHLAPLPVVPLKPCTLQGPGLGMDVDVFDDSGRSVRSEVGYLVCKKPVPSMTKGFWNDRERYIETYWSRFPGIWYHGDWASVDSDGFWFLHGRADDVIKVAGKRLGPSEVETLLMQDRDVVEAAAVGVPDEFKGEALACFVVPRHFPCRETMKSDLKTAVSDGLGRAFAPKVVYVVSALPKTRSGKISRGLIKAVFSAPSARKPDTSSIENPEVLEELRKLAERSDG